MSRVVSSAPALRSPAAKFRHPKAKGPSEGTLAACVACNTAWLFSEEPKRRPVLSLSYFLVVLGEIVTKLLFRIRGSDPLVYSIRI